jgi:hypothetical protein
MRELTTLVFIAVAVISSALAEVTTESGKNWLVANVQSFFGRAPPESIIPDAVVSRDLQTFQPSRYTATVTFGDPVGNLFRSFQASSFGSDTNSAYDMNYFFHIFISQFVIEATTSPPLIRSYSSSSCSPDGFSSYSTKTCCPNTSRSYGYNQYIDYCNVYPQGAATWIKFQEVKTTDGSYSSRSKTTSIKITFTIGNMGVSPSKLLTAFKTKAKNTQIIQKLVDDTRLPSSDMNGWQSRFVYNVLCVGNNQARQACGNFAPPMDSWIDYFDYFTGRGLQGRVTGYPAQLMTITSN